MKSVLAAGLVVLATFLPAIVRGDPLAGWTAWFRGTEDLQAEARSIALDPAGFIYVTGMSGKDSGSGAVVLKYDLQGNLMWSARYVGPAGKDRGLEIAITSDGDPVMACTSEDPDRSWRSEVVQYASGDGAEKWSFRYKSPAGSPTPEGLAATPDGGVALVTTNGNSDTMSTVKIDRDGNLAWEKVRASSLGKDLTVDAAGNIYITGLVAGQGDAGGGLPQDVLTVKYSAGGEQIWAARYHAGTESGKAIALARDGSVVVAGKVSYFGKSGLLILVYDGAGKLAKMIEHHGGANDSGWLTDVGIHPDGDVVATGFFHSDSEGSGIVTAKYGLDGTRRWMRFLEKSGSAVRDGRALGFDRAGNIYLTGYMEPLMVTAKYGPDGTERWVRELQGDWSPFASGYALAVTPGGSVYATGVAIRQGRNSIATIRYGRHHVRGDVDANGGVDLTDAIAYLSWAFMAGEPPPCLEAADVNGDGRISITDPIFLLRRLFQGGAAVPPPSSCGVGPAIDQLGCEEFPACD